MLLFRTLLFSAPTCLVLSQTDTRLSPECIPPLIVCLIFTLVGYILSTLLDWELSGHNSIRWARLSEKLTRENNSEMLSERKY